MFCYSKRVASDVPRRTDKSQGPSFVSYVTKGLKPKPRNWPQ